MPLCLKYINKPKIKYVLCLTQLYAQFIILLLMATSFGLKRPPSGQYLPKRTYNAGEYSKKRQFCGIPFTVISGFLNYYQTINECERDPIQLTFFVLYTPAFLRSFYFL